MNISYGGALPPSLRVDPGISSHILGFVRNLSSIGYVMDFRWSEAEDGFYDRILEITRSHINPALKVNDRTLRAGDWPVEAWRLCGTLGLFGLCVPPGWGGLGFSHLTTARMIEAFGKACDDRGLAFAACAHLFAATMPLVEYAAPDLQRLIPALVQGSQIGANAITEGDAGSDAFSLKTSAEWDGSHYLLNGAKTFVTNGMCADIFVVYATINKKFGYLGITAFVVPRSAPGLTIGQPLAKMGLHTASACSIYLSDCRVPATHRLGREGQGGTIFQRSMQWERACLFALYVGMMQRQLDDTIRFVLGRRQFGRPIARNQSISHRIADMKMRLDASRLMLYRACWLADQGQDATSEIAMAKVMVSEAAQRSSLDAIQIHGGSGVTYEFPLADMLLDSIPCTIFSGTSEIQRDLIAKGLGL